MTGDNRLPVLADEIRAAHSAVLEASATATRHAIQAGNLLIEAKAKVPHGDWLAWLKDNCCLSERTAQRYMRLAAKVPDLDPVNASRVSDLPIRDALRAIADQHAEVTPPEKGSDWDTVWAWAEHQIKAPFNAFDLACARGGNGIDLLRNKLCDQIGVPASVAILLGTITEEIPGLRLTSFTDIFEALKRLAPVAKADQQCDGLDIDTANLSLDDQVAIASVLNIVAQRACGFLFNEIDYRDKNWKATTPEAYAEQADLDAGAVCAALLDRYDALLNGAAEIAP